MLNLQKIFMDVSYPGDFYPKWRTEDASRNLANSMAGNTFSHPVLHILCCGCKVSSVQTVIHDFKKKIQ